MRRSKCLEALSLWKVILFTLNLCVLPLVFRTTSFSHTHMCIITTFLFKMMSAIKSGVVSHSRFAKMAERDFKVKFKSYFKSRESVILWIWDLYLCGGSAIRKEGFKHFSLS